ncbi:MAG: hypothetical protein HY526_09840 [Betaproteobacteria bacterium]|nr:hypothetical protein [Betaproteobacteria bacterium]
MAVAPTGHAVARHGWFVYCNGQGDRSAFEGRLEFTIRLIPYDGDDGVQANSFHDASPVENVMNQPILFMFT